MSLAKQLWLATCVLIVIACVASLAASLVSAQAYYQDQLTLKNIDNANSLAIALSHTEKEQALIRSLVDAQFSTGHYRQIKLLVNDGPPLVLEGQSAAKTAPEWFQSLFPLEVPAGVATISDGWVNFGTLFVESDTSYAQASLWVTAKRLFMWLTLVAMVAGLAGSWLVRRISRPLNDVVQQAEAIGEKRFVMSQEPKTTEFRRVVRAMNKLSERVERMLETEAKALSDMRDKALHDPVTGVANREFFLSRLDALISDDDPDAKHTLALIRLPDLTTLNADLGRDIVNSELCRLTAQISELLQHHSTLYSETFIGRLNGSDFGLLLTGFGDTRWLVEELVKQIQSPIDQKPEHEFRLAAWAFQPGISRSDALMRVDHLLARAEQANERTAFDENDHEQIPFRSARQWRDAIQAAVSDGAINSVVHPLVGRDNTPIQQEAKIRLKLNDDWRAAGYFLPWGRRLGLLPEMDAAMIQYITSAERPEHVIPVVAHVCTESLLNEQASQQIISLIENRSRSAGPLSIELPESALQVADLTLAAFIAGVQEHGCEVGISGIGHNLERISRVHELGLDYIKIDPVFAQRLEQDRNTQQYLQRLTALAHSIGLQVYLAGVTSLACVAAAWDTGFDGVTGPGVVTSAEPD